MRAAATLDHPNIVSIYSVGEERGVHYYAMQLIRGQSLASVIAQLRCGKSERRGSSADDVGHSLSTKLGRPEEAELMTRRAVSLAEAALAAQPAKPRCRDVLATNLASLGRLLWDRNLSASISVLEQAAKLRDELNDQFPDVPNYLSNSVQTHLNLMTAYKVRANSVEHNDAGDLEKAIGHGEKLVVARRTAIDRFPTKLSRDQNQWLCELLWLSELLAKAGRSTESSQAFQNVLEHQRKALQIAEREVEKSPKDDEKRLRLFKALSVYAQLSQIAGDSRASEFHERAQLQLSMLNAAPDIQGVDAAGNLFKLSDYTGKVVLLDFFADWCPYCTRMYPLERRLVDAYQDRPFAVLGVNTDSGKVLQDLIEQNKVTWRCWAEGRPIAEAWQVYSYPTIYLIDHRGVVRRHFRDSPNDASEKKDFAKAIETLVREAEFSSLPEPRTIVLDTAADNQGKFVTRQLQRDVNLVPPGARWKYLDDGSDQGTAWRTADFDDTDWKRERLNWAMAMGTSKQSSDTAQTA